MHALKQPVYICSARRTAIGSFGGSLASVPTPELGAKVISAVLRESKIKAELIEGLIMGCVLQANLGQAPARQAALGAGLPSSVQALTVNKVCSSGLKAVMLASNEIELGSANAIIAGGMENMSRAPYYMEALRNGARLGHTQAQDSIIKDGLWDPYSNQHMGNCAELCASEHQISREQQDQFCLQSYDRALKAVKEGLFSAEIEAIKIKVGKTENEVNSDEEPGKLKRDKVTELKPVFDKAGTVTAANASSINDGAAAMLVCSESFVKKHNLTPLARIVAQGWHAQAPEWFTTAPIGAIENLLRVTKREVSAIDLFEINEAFSVVALAIQNALKIPDDKLNIHGGAVALGHPIGASGARILTTLVHSLKRYNLKSGVAAICNGGGEATAMLVESV